MSALQIQTVAPGIASVAVSTDAEPHFAWTAAELATAMTGVASDPATRVILLEGGTTYFSAGGNKQLLVGPDAQQSVPALVAAIPRVLLDVEVPLIAVVVGHALGGGLGLALCCDLMLLAEESLYGANFVALGFPPGMGSTVLLAEMVGEPLAREMLFTGRVVKGRELARASGAIAHAVLPRAGVRRRALEIAGEVAAVPRETLVAAKRLVAGRRRAAVLAAVDAERDAQMALLGMGQIRSRIAAVYGAPVGLEEE